MRYLTSVIMISRSLDRKLKDLNGIPNKPFGGQSIIFSGDFRQFEAILAKYLLYDRNGSQLGRIASTV